LPTLYFSADMSAFTASARLASMMSGKRTEEIEEAMALGGGERFEIEEALRPLEDTYTFSFGSPITWGQVDEEIAAFVEFNDEFPQVMVFDNLMDIEGAETDYSGQMEAMGYIMELARLTGALCLVLHHA